ncbi:hypothetical protein CKO44_05430 [Rubrivivax gelatinosus]|nr:hypothetical protein [Rubrivivax gelatinosus]
MRKVKTSRHIAIASSLFGAVIIAFAYYYMAVKYCLWPFVGMSSSGKGEFGDAFGAFTSLFSALGFGGVLFTLWLQRRGALSQSFETTVFSLLNAHGNIIQDLDVQKLDGSIRRKGRDCFRYYFKRCLKKYYDEEVLTNPTVLESEIIKLAFMRMYSEHRHNLGHYFRFIYNIFRYIHESSIEYEEKLRYCRIVRSQLSDYELLLLFYNGLNTYGNEKFKPLIEDYAIFNNLPLDLLLNAVHKSYYASTAYELPTSDASQETPPK